MSETGQVPPHIVDAARHVLAQDGLAAATLERISAAAGVSRMTLHRRGVSKDDILRAIAGQLETDYREAIWPALVSKGTGQERLRYALELLCGVTERNLSLLSALSAASRDAIYHESGPRALTRKVFVEPLERLLLDGAADGTLAGGTLADGTLADGTLADGTLADGDAEEMATVVFNVVGHTYTHLRVGHGWTAKRARTGVLALVMDGVVAR